MLIEKLKKIAENGIKGLTDTDKRFVEAVSEQLGCEFKRTKCRNCYIDQCLVLISKLKPKQAPSADENRKYRLKSGLDVYFKNKRVNEQIYDTDAKVLELLRDGFPISLCVCE